MPIDLSNQVRYSTNAIYIYIINVLINIQLMLYIDIYIYVINVLIKTHVHSFVNI
jgi:hypothetical protein